MPRKKGFQKNPFRKHAKKPEKIYLAIVRQFCDGVTQTEAAGKMGLSRQTINRHYREIGNVLWFLFHLEEYGEPPFRNDLPKNSSANDVYDFVDPAREKILEVHNHIQEYPKHKQILPYDPVSLFDTYALREVRISWQKMRGIPQKTFYIYWYRSWWLGLLHSLNPLEGYPAIKIRLFEKIIRERHLYRKPEDRQLRSIISQQDRTQYFVLGRLLVKIHKNKYGDPYKAERYSYRTRQLTTDLRLLVRIFLDNPGDLYEITKEDFSEGMSIKISSDFSAWILRFY